MKKYTLIVLGLVFFHAALQAQNTTKYGNYAGGSDTKFGAYFGYAASYSNTGIKNTAMGVNTGAYSKGDELSFFGLQAGYNSQGNAHVFIGSFAGQNNNGSSNTFMGYRSGYLNKGDHNTPESRYTAQVSGGKNLWLYCPGSKESEACPGEGRQRWIPLAELRMFYSAAGGGLQRNENRKHQVERSEY